MTRSMFTIVVAFLYGTINQRPIITVIGKAFWDVGHAPKINQTAERGCPSMLFWEIRFAFSIQTAQSKGSFRLMRQNETMTDAMICYTCGLRNGV